ncbi:MAG TPA: glycosyl hydrolase [Anaerohalosphaeraceae bacterium]|nr:glycosyl hydrolase [Anaerohalosphaeraceae bacterium]HPP56683.1 glycosyl hydrolase [Anaerohalosphaeraceae bacterium]
MNRWVRLARQAAGLLVALGLSGWVLAAQTQVGWPTPTAENKPWTRWWWMGSAVNEADLSFLLEEYSRAGIGGVEICPIYGVKGYEERFIDFLSPKWMKMLAHTTAEAQRLGMGVDLTTGTGWPFGGPHIPDELASMKVICERYSVSGGQVFEASVPKNSRAYLMALIAVAADGHRMDLTAKVKDGKVRWEVPQGSWRIYELSGRRPVQKVKRAAPGSAGNVVDPFSVSALEKYLAAFDKAFAGYSGRMPRAHFHDSFEYFEADWTAEFFREFQKRRGYDLRDYVECLFGEDSSDTAARVKCDYRRTLSELHIAYIECWTQWCHRYKGLSRNQAHGAPANLIDLYAAADIPETEIFRSVDSRQIPMMKMASSAAHLKGQPITSAESFTWLKEHFQASLADAKAAADFLFLAGVNHIFFHGIPYSPQDAPWPGWQFYASVNFGPGGGLWQDLPAFTDYLTRCQSILQAGRPDNEILLYWPVYDLWQDSKGFYQAFRIHNQDQWFYDSSFYKTAMDLWSRGYGYDAVSDRFLQKGTVRDGKIVLGGNSYSVVLIPACRLMPTETLETLLKLADRGAVILFDSGLPTDVPGLKDWQKRREKLNNTLHSLAFRQETAGSFRSCVRKKGKILVGNIEPMLQAVGICREACTDTGIQVVRRSHPEGYYYFLANQSQKPLERWIPLGRPARSAVLMDPLRSERVGLAAVRSEGGQTQVYIQMTAGQSLILKTFSKELPKASAWTYLRPGPASISLEGRWMVEFIQGGPSLPKPRQIERLDSWTRWGDEETECFAGTARYTLEFEKPGGTAEDWILDLGTVCESARVRLNGKEVGVFWTPPYACRVGGLLRDGLNKLEIDVTNLAANRIRDLDRRQVRWKYFYDINVVNIDYKPFNAAEWPLRDSGLLGPVRLIPAKILNPFAEPNRKEDKPTLFIIGDSTVKNNTPGLQGWGDPIAEFFDLSKMSVQNRAIGGRSSRTFLTEGRWQRVLEEMKEGDFLLIQFGHNDSGPLATSRARASLKGIGDETEEVTLEATGQKEVVHTYGWYLRKYIREAKEKGVQPILLSPVPRNIWKDGKLTRAGSDYAAWAAQVAQAEGVPFINLNESIARVYEQQGQEKVSQEYFLEDHTHTTPAGARLNALMVVEGIRKIEDCQLRHYLK